ncbi:MAG: 6-hydroxymethylpterin diphosphokinase MptE-like protein [Candidatus Thermoplasmatota archaeon]
MDFEEWEPYYRQILEDFGFSREADERAARVLDATLGGTRIDPEGLRPLFAEKDVTIAGNAPSLAEELVAVEHPLLAADEATSVLRKAGIRPDVIITDLDGDVADQVAANAEGAVVVVHAHGDNVPAIEAWAPKFRGRVIGTTQARPFGRIHNFGGFTDGDRAAFLADHLGARSLLLLGFDFENPSPKDADPQTKRRKLDWAYILLQTLDVSAYEE